MFRWLFLVILTVLPGCNDMSRSTGPRRRSKKVITGEKARVVADAHAWLSKFDRNEQLSVTVVYKDHPEIEDPTTDWFKTVSQEQLFGSFRHQQTRPTFGTTTGMFLWGHEGGYRAPTSVKIGLNGSLFSSELRVFVVTNLELAGVFVALAINSKVKLEIPFSAFFLANLIDVPVTVKDLEGYDDRLADLARRVASSDVADLLNTENRYTEPLGKAFAFFKKGFLRMIFPDLKPKSVREFREVLGLEPGHLYFN